MPPRLVDRVMVRRLDTDDSRLVPDEVVVEEPLEIRLDGNLVTTTMRTPGHDFELAAGFCHGDGLLAGAPVHEIRYCATGSAVETGFNVVDVGTRGKAPKPTPRLVPTGSSCGLCGSEAIEDLTRRLAPLSDHVPPIADLLRLVPDRARASQALFDRTGAVHAAAAFRLDNGEIEVLREDIGRHNAADKVVGRLLLDLRLPAANHGLFLSGRVSFEMVQKAWAAGFSTVLSVGGPSSLAVKTAKTANICLVGFARRERLNIYTGDVR